MRCCIGQVFIPIKHQAIIDRVPLIVISIIPFENSMDNEGQWQAS